MKRRTLRNRRVHFEEVKRNGIRCVVDGIVTGDSVTRNKVVIKTKINNLLHLDRSEFITMIDSGKVQLTEKKAARIK